MMDMARNDARNYIRANWRHYIGSLLPEAKRKANGETSYICPVCRHGKGGDGISWSRNASGKAQHVLHCHQCGGSWDIIDLYMMQRGADYNTALREMAEDMGINLLPNGRGITIDLSDEPPISATASLPTGPKAQGTAPTEDKQSADYTAYFRRCMAALAPDSKGAAYIAGRGISLELALQYGMGYDAQADPASAPGGVGTIRYPEPRIIAPTGKGEYEARAIRADIDKQYRIMVPKDGQKGIFGGRNLIDGKSDICFVVEGVYDALSIISIGYPAVAINSVSNGRLLINAINQIRNAGRTMDKAIIVAMDADGKTDTQSAQLVSDLRALGVVAISANISGKYKDANDALQEDKAALKAACDEAAAKAREAASPAYGDDSVMMYIGDAMYADIERHMHGHKLAGFGELDRRIGGLYTGLYVVAAGSSIGKTTFCTQLADQLAMQGHHAIYYSLEQSRLDIAAKSLAREIATKQYSEYPLTATDIKMGKYAPIVAKAQASYCDAMRQGGGSLHIINTGFGATYEAIRDNIIAYMARYHVRPVVIVDYLQAIQPSDQTAARYGGIRERLDYAVTGFKDLSAKCDLTIILICSLNRSSYLTPISFEALKESGMIEYTADAVWGLQLDCMGYKQFYDSRATNAQRNSILAHYKRKIPRRIDLRQLKGRTGRTDLTLYFSYYPNVDLFIENPWDKAAGKYRDWEPVSWDDDAPDDVMDSAHEDPGDDAEDGSWQGADDNPFDESEKPPISETAKKGKTIGRKKPTKLERAMQKKAEELAAKNK